MFTRNHTADKPGHYTSYRLYLVSGEPQHWIVADRFEVHGQTITFYSARLGSGSADIAESEFLVAEFRLDQIAGYRVSHNPIKA